MAVPDFDTAIDIRYYADNWGPFSVELTDTSGVTGIPSNESISDVTVKMYEGKVKPDVDLTGLVDVSTAIIESDSVSWSGKDIYWEMKYPVDSTNYKGKKFTIVFEVTTSGGRKYPFYLYYVKIW